MNSKSQLSEPWRSENQRWMESDIEWWCWPYITWIDTMW